jgi:hypothetical protein
MSLGTGITVPSETTHIPTYKASLNTAARWRCYNRWSILGERRRWRSDSALAHSFQLGFFVFYRMAHFFGRFGALFVQAAGDPCS